MKKIFRKLHLWLSIPFGLIITIICFTGAMLVFEQEFMELCWRDRYYVKQVDEKPLPVDQLIAKVSQTLPDSVSITAVNISANPKKAYQLSLSQPRRASIYVDQYTGEVKWKTERAAFFTYMFRGHRWLLDTMKPGGGIFWGKMIVGTSTLLFVFILITGIIIWIPRNRKALKNSLKISVRKGLKRFWYDLHVAGGIYATILLLIMALTGLTWSFSWYRTGFYKVFGVEMQQGGGGHGAPTPGGQAPGGAPTGGQPNQSQGMAQGSQGQGQGERPQGEGRGERPQRENREGRSQGERTERPEGAERGERPQGGEHGERSGRSDRGARPFAHWQQVYEELAAQNPDYKQISVSAGSANVSFNRWGNQRGSDRYAFDAATGQITDSNLYKDQDKSGKIRGWIYTMHVGSWGGYFSRILTFLAALLGASLPLTGYYLWIKKSINKSRSKKKKARMAC